MSTFRQVVALAVFFVIVGLGCLTGATVLFNRAHSFMATASSAPGVVVGLEPATTSSKGGLGYYTVFKFADKSGQTHRCRTGFASQPAPFKIGCEVTILYPPDDPELAKIKSFHTLWFIPTILCGFGFGFLGAGTTAFVAARKTYGSA